MSNETDPLGERVANIEGTVSRMNERLGGIEDEIAQLDGRMTERFDTLDGRIDDRFDTLDSDLTDLDAKIERVNGRIDERVSAAERSIRRWIAIGLTLVTVALTIVFGVVQIAL